MFDVPEHYSKIKLIILSMELTRQAGNEPSLVGLMRVFKDYYPDVIVGDVTSGRASVFTVSNISISFSPWLLTLFSIRIENGGKDSARSRRFTFRKHKMVYRLNFEHFE